MLFDMQTNIILSSKIIVNHIKQPRYDEIWLQRTKLAGSELLDYAVHERNFSK